MHNLIADNYHQLFFFLRSFCFTPSFYPQVHSSFFFSVPNFLIPQFHLSFYFPFFLFYILLSIHPFFLLHSFPSFLLSFTFFSVYFFLVSSLLRPPFSLRLFLPFFTPSFICRIHWKNWTSSTVWKFYFQNISRIFPYHGQHMALDKTMEIGFSNLFLQYL